MVGSTSIFLHFELSEVGHFEKHDLSVLQPCSPTMYTKNRVEVISWRSTNARRLQENGVDVQKAGAWEQPKREQ